MAAPIKVDADLSTKGGEAKGGAFGAGGGTFGDMVLSGGGSNMMTILMLGGMGLLWVYLTKK